MHAKDLRLGESPSGIVRIRAPGEVFLPFRHPFSDTPPVTEGRTTTIVSAAKTLRGRGLHERYIAALPVAARDQILSLVAGVWIPIDLVLEHYRAMDSLGLDPKTVDSIGAELAERTNRTVLSTAVSLSKQVGVTPWSALKIAYRLNDINWKGGDIAIWKLGPKEAQWEWLGQPCASVPYFARSLGSFNRALTSMFCTKSYVRLMTERCTRTSLSYRFSWV